MGDECQVKQKPICVGGPVNGQVMPGGRRGEDSDWIDACKPCMDWFWEYCGPDKRCYAADGYCGPSCEWWTGLRP